jgi:hypothetical protein
VVRPGWPAVFGVAGEDPILTQDRYIFQPSWSRIMTTEQLHELAFDFGLQTSVPCTSQMQLIRYIQLRSGSEPCFQSEKRYVCTEICKWSQECRKLKAQWLC